MLSALQVKQGNKGEASSHLMKKTRPSRVHPADQPSGISPTSSIEGSEVMDACAEWLTDTLPTELTDQFWLATSKTTFEGEGDRRAPNESA